MAGQGVSAQVFVQWNDINFAMLKSWALKAVVDLGLPDILAKAGKELTTIEIAQKLPSETVNVEYLYRLMTYATTLGIFKIGTVDSNNYCNEERASGGQEIEAGDVTTMRKKVIEQKRFGTTPFSMALTEECNLNPNTSLANISRFFFAGFSMPPCYKLAEAVLTGKHPFNIAHNVKDEWEFSREVPEWGTMFNKAMVAFSSCHMDIILQSYKGFDGIKLLVDVGGGLGASLEAIIRAYPDIKGINFDVPFVIGQAPEIAGVKHVSGDMFEGLPEGEADAIFMKFIIHDWNDEQSVQILKNCYKVLPSHGKVILAESILPPVEEVKHSSFQYDSDFVMMVHTSGRERTKAEFQKILAEAGFPRIEVFTTEVLSVIEGFKA